MPVPSPRNKILPARGNYVDLDASVASLLDGEICYAIDQDQYYQNEGGALVSVGATKTQGALADTSLQPLDNISTLTNDAGYITLGEVPVDAVTSVNTQTGAVVLDADDIDDSATTHKFATAAQLSNADSATQPGDNVSTLTNDAGFITSASVPVDSVNAQTGVVVLDADDISDSATTNKFATQAELNSIASATQPGDNVSGLTNDAGYITLAEVPPGGVTSVAGKTGDVILVKADITDFSDSDYATAAQGLTADSATQPLDNVSTLTNDAGYITATGTYWTEGTNQLYPADAGNSVLIGGTLPSAPNISLNAVGSARFADKLISGADSSGSALAGAVLEPSGKLTVSRAGGGAEVFRGKEASRNNPTSQIFADGSATFAGNVGIAISSPGAKLDVQGDIRSRTANPYFYLNNNSTQWSIRNNANQLTFEYQGSERLHVTTVGDVLIGGTLPSSPNITLRAGDGSVLTPTVDMLGSPAETDAALTVGHTWGETNEPCARFGYGAPDSFNQRAVINRDGSAEFAADVTSGTGSYSTGDNAALHSLGSVSASRTGTNVVWAGYTTGNSVATSTINAAGSAQFADDVLIGGTLPSAPNIELNADGSAQFTGTVQTTERTITSVAFDLATGNHWTCGAITVPAPTNVVTGTSGLIRITAGPVTWDAAFKFPGGSAPTIASFPAVIPFYVQSSSVLLMGNVTEGIA